MTDTISAASVLPRVLYQGPLSAAACVPRFHAFLSQNRSLLPPSHQGLVPQTETILGHGLASIGRIGTHALLRQQLEVLGDLAARHGCHFGFLDTAKTALGFIPQQQCREAA